MSYLVGKARASVWNTFSLVAKARHPARGKSLGGQGAGLGQLDARSMASQILRDRRSPVMEKWEVHNPI